MTAASLDQLAFVVTIHDQDLLSLYESQNKFAGLGKNFFYVFVGKGPCDQARLKSNVIIARELSENIEEYKYLVDFTCWYALVKNRILSHQYVSLIQYDVSITSNFADRTIGALQASPEAILGYVPLAMSDDNFIRRNMGFKPLEQACRAVYGIEIGSLLKSHAKLSHDKMWPTTNNVAMSHEALQDFVRWFTPLAMHMGNEKPSGHAFERAIKLYSILSGRGNSYLTDALSHFQMNSHETQNFKKDKKTLSSLLAKNIMWQK